MLSLAYQKKVLNNDFVGLIDVVQNTPDIVLAYDVLHFLRLNFSEIEKEFYPELQLMSLPDFEHNQVVVDVPEPAILDYLAPVQALAEILAAMASDQPVEEDLTTQLMQFHYTQAKARSFTVVCVGEDIQQLFDSYAVETAETIEYVDEENRRLNPELMTAEEKALLNPLRTALKDFELVQVSATMPIALIQQLTTFASQAVFTFIQEGDTAKLPLKLFRTFPHMFKHPKLKVVALGDVENAGEAMHVFTELARDQYGLPRDEKIFFGYEGLAVVVGRLLSNFEPVTP